MHCRWAAGAILLLIAGCSRKDESAGIRRVALPPIENLTREATSVAGEALRIAVWDSLLAQARVHPLLVAHQRDLAELGSANVLQGYISDGRIHLQLQDRVIECSGAFAACMPRVVGEIASYFGAAGRTAMQPNTALAIAQSRSATAGKADLQLAAEQDSANGTLWLAWADTVRRTDGVDAAAAILSKAPTGQMNAVDATRVALNQADLHKDSNARLEALLKLASLSPADSLVQAQAAETAIALRRFKEAVAVYENALATSADTAMRNQAAYAAAFLGDQEKAIKFAADNARAAPASAPVADTQGEIVFLFGRYAEAAKHFQRAADSDATFGAGIAYWKAAEALRLAGDNSGAARLAEQYFEFRRKAGQPNTLLLEAIWDWRRGADDEALSKLGQAEGTTDRNRAIFLEALIALNRRDLSAARNFAGRMEPNTAEAVVLRCLVDGTVPPPQIRVPAPLLLALHAYAHGDNKKAAELYNAGIQQVHPFQTASWPLLEAKLKGAKPTGVLPISPDDWVAVLLR